MNRDELKAAIAEVAVSAGNGNGKSAYAELITTLVQPKHITLEVFKMFMDTEERKPGDYFARKIRKGKFRARSMVPGAQHLTDAIIYNSQFQYVFDRMIAGTAMNIMEIRNGELGTVEEIKSEVSKDLIDEVCAKVFNLLTTVWSVTNTPSNYINATSTGLTSTALDVAMENTIEKAGNIKAIVGTRRALLPLYSFAGYHEVAGTGANTNGIMPLNDVLMERFNTGKVSSYNNATVVEMPQILENRLPLINRKLVRDDVVLVIGENPGKLVTFGEAEEQEYNDYTKQPYDWQYHTWINFGILIDRPEYITIIKTY